MAHSAYRSCINHCTHIIYKPYRFLAAMSSSRSDDVTKSVSLSVCSHFFLVCIIQCIRCKMFQGCFKDVLRVFQGSFKVFTKSFKCSSRKFKGCFKEVLRVFQETFKGVSSKIEGHVK